LPASQKGRAASGAGDQRPPRRVTAVRRSSRGARAGSAIRSPPTESVLSAPPSGRSSGSRGPSNAPHAGSSPERVPSHQSATQPWGGPASPIRRSPDQERPTYGFDRELRRKSRTGKWRKTGIRVTSTGHTATDRPDRR